MQIIGRLFQSHSASSQVCRLVLTSEAPRWVFESLEGMLLFECAKVSVKVEPKVGSLPRKITLPDGGLFETEDSAAVDLLDGSTFWQRISRFEGFGPHLFVVAAICLIGSFAVYRFGLPLLVKLAVALTPQQIPLLIDASSLKAIDTAIVSPTKLSESRQTELKEIFDDLVQIAEKEGGTNGFSFRLLFRDAKLIGPNAFALPGGTVIFTDQMIKTFPDKELLAGVMAHEIGHVVHQHSLNQIYRAFGIAAMVAVIAGDAGPILEDVLLEGNTLLALSFSRSHESEADAFSVNLMRKAGRDPSAIISFFEAIQKEYGSFVEDSWLSSHPGTSTRIDNIKALLEQTK